MKAEKLILFRHGRNHIRKHTNSKFKFSNIIHIELADGKKPPRLRRRVFPYYIEVGRDWESKTKIMSREKTLKYLSKVLLDMGYSTNKTQLHSDSKTTYAYRILSGSFDSGYISLAKYRKLAAKLNKFSNISAIF
jgi:hypothetical protein